MPPGADVNEREKGEEYIKFEQTPLHYAVIHHSMECIAALLEAGADIEMTDNEIGSTILQSAAIKNFPEIINILLKAGAEIEAKDHSGKTALHYAAMTNATESIAVLLKAGANIDAKNSHAVALNALVRLFQGTILETAFSFFAEGNAAPTAELKAVSLKSLLVADTLRLFQFFIYADDDVKDSELEAAYHLYKPFAKFCAMTNSDFDRFDNLERSAVVDFMHIHMQEQGINGGNIQLSRELFGNPSRINSLSKEEHRKLQVENITIPLTMALNAAGEESSLSAYLTTVTFYMGAIGQVTSVEEFHAVNTQDLTQTAAKYNLGVFEKHTALRRVIMQEINRCIEHIPESTQNRYFNDIRQGMARAKSTHTLTTTLKSLVSLFQREQMSERKPKKVRLRSTLQKKKRIRR